MLLCDDNAHIWPNLCTSEFHLKVNTGGPWLLGWLGPKKFPDNWSPDKSNNLTSPSFSNGIIFTSESLKRHKTNRIVFISCRLACRALPVLPKVKSAQLFRRSLPPTARSTQSRSSRSKLFHKQKPAKFEDTALLRPLSQRKSWILGIAGTFEISEETKSV